MQLTVLSASLIPATASGDPLLQMCELLGHRTEVLPLEAPRPLPARDVVVIDARSHQVQARNAAVQIASSAAVPLMGLIGEAGFAAVSASWPVHEWISEGASATELQARLQLCLGRAQETAEEAPAHLNDWGLEIDEGTYTVRVHGTALNLTYKEFELLKFLSSSPDQVFTREQLLSEVWGFDYYGGTRTVDVHVRRLRAKLGSDHEQLIGTVRNVGYLFSSARS